MGEDQGGATFSYCCTTPGVSGANITDDPQLLEDGIHLANTSPCRAAGVGPASGTDIDGQPWSNPPSIGCDDWQPVPLLLFPPSIRLVSDPIGLSIGIPALGQEPFTCWWTRDGVAIENDGHFGSAHTTNLVATGISPRDAGGYYVVVSNAYGMATSAVAQVVIHCVDAAGTGPAPPYADWATAATNIQDAIDAAGAGEFVLVTNGVYCHGGKVLEGGLTNRVALIRPLAVTSVNGPAATFITGAWDPVTTNGPLAVRCAWLTNGATLNGFTLQGGATGNAGSSTAMGSGGGVWCSSSNAFVMNCVISNNAANCYGGGCYQGTLSRCRVQSNRSSQYGGGTYLATVVNSVVLGNASFYGGGAYGGSFFGCTISGNFVLIPGWGGGICRDSGTPAVLRNCVVYNNGVAFPAPPREDDWATLGPVPDFAYSCTTPSPGGAGNITANPQLLDGIHLPTTSPCRGAGNAAYSSESDIDGEAWASPPSMGCDEVWEAAIKGPLSVTLSATWTNAAEGAIVGLVGGVSGRASRVAWSFGDGSILTNASVLITWRSWTNPGDYTVTFIAFNADNPAGVSTNLVVHILPNAPALSAGGLTSNEFGLTFLGESGVTYIVEQATNLTTPVTWQTVSSLLGTGGTVQITDDSATNAQRFYRVRTQ